MKKKKASKVLLIVFIVLFVLVIALGFIFVKTEVSPISDDDTITQRITINENMIGKDVINVLEQNGIIRNSQIVYYYAKLNKIPMNFKAGTYEVSLAWNIEDLFSYLNDGKNAVDLTVTISFIEGNRAKDFAELIAEKTNLEYDEIMNYWNDETVIKSFAKDYSFINDEMFNEDIKCLVEGYLLPDTYEFYTTTNLEDVTKKFFDNTQKVYDLYIDDFNNNEFSVHEIFTLASIIQRESGNKSDMQLISSVFHNRLQFGMNLQSSVTVCYALDIGLNSEDWYKCEITQENRDPYNTYQVSGLPPGPISNPGKDAIYAALNPEESEYFYFIGDVCGDGTTYFAETYQQQLENQERYLTCY